MPHEGAMTKIRTSDANTDKKLRSGLISLEQDLIFEVHHGGFTCGKAKPTAHRG